MMSLKLKPSATIALAVLSACLPCLSLAETRDESLAHAVRNGDVVAARTLLANRADPNHRLPDGSTPLAWAVDSQNREMVRLLLDRSARPDGTGAASLTPLMVACQYGDPAILDMLIDAGADAKITGPDGIAALSMCAGNAPVTILERLIAAGAAVDKADANGQTPLMWAAAKGRVDNIRLLIDRGALVNRKTEKGFTPLFFALKSGEPGAPVAIVEAGGDADYAAPDGTSVVQLAIYQKAYDFAARMIERGANLQAFDRQGNQLLHAAVLANQPALVTLLLAKGADVNALTGPSKVKLRFEVNFKSGDFEVPPRSALLLAAEHGSADIMKILVGAGADTKFRMADGTNIVLAAATSGKLAALELALQLQPDANTTTASGQTPLHLLLGSNASSDTGAMMRLLADKGARIDIKNRAGKTPADFAKEAETDMKIAYEASFAHRTVSKL
jgi:ankyrin repeat protein